jgi:hypothetical protein
MKKKKWFFILLSINQSINQSINKSTNQQINKSTNQQINQSINQSISQDILLLFQYKPHRNELGATIGTFLLPTAKRFLDAVSAESMQTILGGPGIPQNIQANGTLKFILQQSTSGVNNTSVVFGNWVRSPVDSANNRHCQQLEA